MSIPGINSLLNALDKGGLPLPKPHGMDWPPRHPLNHDGGGPKGFPLGAGKPDHPLGAPPGQSRPDIPQTTPPTGIDRPIMAPGNPPGVERPPVNPGNTPGPDRPGPGNAPGPDRPGPGPGNNRGQGLVRDIAGLVPQTLQAGVPPAQAQAASLLHAQPQAQPLQAQGHASQPVQLPMPAMAAQATSTAGPLPLVTAPLALQQTLQPTQQAQAPAPAQTPPSAPRADASQQASLPQAQAPRAEASQTLPPRPDAAPIQRGGANTAMLQRAPAAPMPLAMHAATMAANPAAAGQAAIAATAAGTTMAAAPTAMQAANPAAESRAVNPLIVADRAQVVARSDIAGTYTGEGPGRRGLRRAAGALPGGLSTLLMAFGAQGHAGAAGRDPAAVERELRAAMMQWLFWLLAIIAYGCIAFAVIGLLPSGSLGGAIPTSAGGRAWAGGFALAGLVAALGAWGFARGMTRGGGDGHDRDGTRRSGKVDVQD